MSITEIFKTLGKCKLFAVADLLHEQIKTLPTVKVEKSLIFR
jgi:hypothetical protein